MHQLITLSNETGMQVTVSNFGARLTSILFPTQNGLQEMLLTYQDPQDFKGDPFYLGTTCGRVANRIAGGQFSIGTDVYLLSKNEESTCLHGGREGFSHRYWAVKTSNKNTVELALTSPDGDQGFPGEVSVTARFCLSDTNCLTLEYHATTTKACPINLTNHAYFNLGEEDISNLLLTLNAECYLEKNANNLPTGKILPVKDTKFDFTSTRTLLTNTHLDNPVSGYDDCFVLDKTKTVAAELISKRNEIKLQLMTNQPGIQVYSGGFLSSPFKQGAGVCLEAQNFPNAINISHFPNSVVLPAQVYYYTTQFQFTALSQ